MKLQSLYSHGLLYSVAPDDFCHLHLKDMELDRDLIGDDPMAVRSWLALSVALLDLVGHAVFAQ